MHEIMHWDELSKLPFHYVMELQILGRLAFRPFTNFLQCKSIIFAIIDVAATASTGEFKSNNDNNLSSSPRSF